MSTFFGLNVALSGIRAHQQAMHVTGHNIANASTPGFRRQEAVMIAGTPTSGIPTALGASIAQLGTGVLVHSIRRAQTDLLDTNIRMTSQWYGEWHTKYTALSQLEPILTEPGNRGLLESINKFWNSWEDLAATPEDLSARIAVLENGVGLTERIQMLDRSLRSVQADTDRRLMGRVNDINLIAQEIASLNAQISQPIPGLNQPNDVLDRRDLLLEQLSQMVGIEVHGAGGADLIVSIGGHILVQGAQSRDMDVANGPDGWRQVVWAADGSQVQINSGELAGLMDIRDNVIAGYLDSLNALAQALVTRVNEVHSSGIGLTGEPGGDFFVAGSSSSNIRVNADLLRNPSRVAAGGPDGGPGDNLIANAIASIRNEVLVNGQTISGAYTGLIAEVGAHISEARTRMEVHDISLNQRKTQRESIAGVSIDEEMINMVKFQQGYNAAVRILTVMDEMIETVVNRMGIIGR